MSRGMVELRKERVEAAEVIAKAVEMATPLLELRAHHLTIDAPPSGLAIDADPFRMAQVVSNLLTNAGKYTDAGGHIAVRAAMDEGGRVAIAVADSGVGISGEMLPRVFDMFAQEPQMLDRSQGGLGLGLTIVRGLVALHGGTVEARSEGRGRGSEFVVRVPAFAPGAADGPRPTPRRIALGKPAALGAPEPDGAPTGDGARAAAVGSSRRILVVDDNEDAGEMLGEYLRDLGHEVAVASDGPGALRVASTFAPEIALLDIGLPVMDGYELASRLRAQSAAARLTIVAVTGYGQEADRRRATDVGFQAHLVKPVDLEKLDAVIRAAGASPDAAVETG
jgi:CheY-like chemotaxis protein